MKKTFKELKGIDGIYGDLLGRIENFEQTKLGYAFKRFSDKNLTKLFSDYNSALQDMKIDHALTDKETGAILYTPDRKDYLYTPENLKTVLKKSREMQDEWSPKEFDVEPFICKNIDAVNLTDDEKEQLEGVIINNSKKN